MNKIKILGGSRGAKMSVAGFMSGSGTNLRKIIEFERNYAHKKKSCPFEVVVIFSDTYNSNAPEIGKDFNIPVVIRDIRSFYATKSKKGKQIQNMEIRAEFDENTINALSPYNISVIAYAGYMSIASERLVKGFPGVNIHPADLSIMHGGKRKYTGAHAVRDAIVAREKHIASTTHLLDTAVDEGPILMISPPLKVDYGENFDPHNEALLQHVAAKNQQHLKEKGDWVIFPLTLLYLAEGKFTQDEHNNLFFDGKRIPYGVKLEEDDSEIRI
ncbi:MAG: phosphoribosylglycinamide formyltransferase [bacterium]